MWVWFMRAKMSSMPPLLSLKLAVKRVGDKKKWWPSDNSLTAREGLKLSLVGSE